MRPRAIAPALALLAAIASCDRVGPGPSESSPAAGRKGVTEVGPIDPGRVVAEQVIYVPAYSHVATGDDANPLNLAITLAVRNADPDHPIVLGRVHYLDSGAGSVRDFLKSPLRIEPLASAEFFVKESDTRGGGSPSFLVQWASEGPAVDPVVESVMIGTVGTQGISFACPGRAVRTRRRP